LAYILARMQSRWAAVLLSAVIIASFITIVIKVLGLLLIFASNGPFNAALRWIGLVDHPVTINRHHSRRDPRLMYYTLGFAVLLFYSVIVTISRSLEEAAENPWRHRASADPPDRAAALPSRACGRRPHRLSTSAWAASRPPR